MFRNYDTFPQDHSGEYLLLTLKEVKAMVESTSGRSRPTPRYLREYGTLLVRKEMDSCCLEVYTSGFAIYQTERHYTVLRMEETGEPGYSSVADKNSRKINTENMDWSIGVMICGEERIEAGVVDMDADRLVSMTFSPPYDYGYDPRRHGMEFNADVDITEEVLETDVIEMLFSNLTERQKQLVHMYYFEEMTHREIARSLNVDRSAISKCLKTIINKAKKIFGQEFTF